MGLPGLAAADCGGIEATDGMTWFRGVGLWPPAASRLCKFKGRDIKTCEER